MTNVRSYLQQNGGKLPKKASAPFSNGYCPEVDITPELSLSDATHYQSLVGVLRWIVELGRIDITTETSELSSMMASPREGHLDALYHVFAYLHLHHNAEMIFDPTKPQLLSLIHI